MLLNKPDAEMADTHASVHRVAEIMMPIESRSIGGIIAILFSFDILPTIKKKFLNILT